MTAMIRKACPLFCIIICAMLFALPLRSAAGIPVYASDSAQNAGAGSENEFATGDPDDKAFTVSENGPSNNPTAIVVAVIFFLVCAALIFEWVFSAIKKHEKTKNERFSKE